MLSEAEIYFNRKGRFKLAEIRKEGKVRFRPSWKDLILNELGNKCSRCPATTQLHIDHIIPLGKGGEHRLSNVQLLCVSCHRAKTIDEDKYTIGRNLK